MQSSTALHTGILLIGSLLVSGCASTHVAKIQATRLAEIERPERVLIQDFTVNASDVRTSTSPLARMQRMMSNDSSEKKQMALGREVADALATELSEKIKQMGFQPVRVDRNAHPKPGDIVIGGRFLSIEEGNAVRRNLIGLGAGQSSLDSEVHVQTMTADGVSELLTFSAHADSGSTPGAAVMGPVGAAAGAGTAATVGVNMAKGAATTYQSASAHQASAVADQIAKKLRIRRALSLARMLVLGRFKTIGFEHAVDCSSGYRDEVCAKAVC